MSTIIVVLLLLYLVFVVLCNDDYDARLCYNKAVLCETNSDFECAIKYYNEAINLYHDFPQAHQNLGGSYDAIGEYEKSLHHHKISLSLSSDDVFRAGALSNIAIAENRIMTISATHDESKLNYIIGLMEDALTIAPNHRNALRNLGLLYGNIGSYEKSLKVFIDMLYYYPNNNIALLNIGNYYFRNSDFVSSSYFYHRASEHAESVLDKVSCINNLGQSYRERTMYAKSISSFKKAMSIISNYSYELTAEEKDSLMTYTMINSYAVKLISCDWQSLELYEFYLTNFIISQSTVINSQNRIRTIFDEFFGDAFNFIDPYTFTLFRFSSLQVEHLTCALACEQTGYKLIDDWNSTLPDSKLLSIGYISYDWRNHPMGRLTKWLVTHHNVSKFETSLISYGPDDRSDIRKYVEGNSNFIDISPEKNDFVATRYVHNMNLNILIDITMHTFNGRVLIPASKPAPIVINYLGFPGTSGCKGFDYIMLHPLLVSPEASFEAVSEKLIYLPDIYQSNYMPRDHNLGRCIKPSDCRYKLKLNKYVGPIFCSFNAFKKLEPLVFDTWMNILRRTQNAILLLLASDASDEIINNNLKMQALYHGISPNRLVFLPHLPWTQHLDRAGACDMVLDSFVYGAHTTSTDMLWMWVPILALQAWGHGRMPSRVASSIVSSLIINDKNPKRQQSESVLKSTMVTSVYEYEDTAARIGTVQRYAEVIHDAIGQLVLHRPTFDHNAMELSIESAYQSTWEAYNIKKLRDSNNKNSHIIITKRSRTEQLVDIMGISVRVKNGTSNMDTNSHKKTEIASDELFEDCDNIKDDDFFTLVLESYTGQKLLSGILLFCLQTKPFSLLSALDKTINELDIGTKCKKIDYLFSLWSKHLYLKSTDYLYLYDVSSNSFSTRSSSAFDRYFEILQPVMDHLRENSFPGYILLPLVVKNMERELLSLNNSVHVSNLTAMINAAVQQSSRLLFEQGLCSLEKGNMQLSWSYHFSGLINSISAETETDLNNIMLQNVGLLLQSSSFANIGFIILNEAILKLQMSAFLNCKADNLIEEGINRGKSIAFYCYEYGNSWWPNFGPSSVGPKSKGVGGSEEAVIYIARALASMGFDVRVYADPLASDIGTIPIGSGFLTWQHYSCFDVTQQLDIFISWRYAASIMLGLNAKQRFLWIHDLIDPSVFPNEYWDKVSGIFVQSEFHRQFIFNSQHVSINNNLYVVPNGVYMSNKCHGPNHNDIFVYGSSPNRGLEKVLLVWPHIKRHIPSAILEVYYGFNLNVDIQLGRQMGSRYTEWKQKLLGLLEQEGVDYKQTVDHNTLMTAYSRAGFILYPTTFQETGCITIMKAMACGSIPITSRLADSVLYNLTKDYDFGPTTALNLTIGQNEASYIEWIYEEWLPSVLRVSTYSYQEIKEIRKNMKKYGRSMSWEKSAMIMSSYFK